jgi:GNAT superfamily N-acetyltransferase
MRIEVKRLCPQLLDDYLDYFDNVAFTDNPDWAGCYCYFYLAGRSTGDWNDRTAAENRSAVGELIATGGMHGYLAYLEGEVAGWCHAGPKGYFPVIVETEELAEPDIEATGSIVCFNIAPEQRRLGIASTLLEAATTGLADMGLTIAEAYPSTGASTEAAHYHGPLPMYLRAGFSVHRRLPSYQVVRKALGGQAASA